MKRNIWMLILLLVNGFCMVAQSAKTIKVDAGDDITAAIFCYGIIPLSGFCGKNDHFKKW